MCVLMGRAFAFVQSDLVDCDPTDSDSRQSRLYCCLGEPVTIDGVTLDALPLPHCDLLVATADRELYYEGESRVHLFVYDPAKSGNKVNLQLHSGLLKVRDLPLVLNESGGGEVTLEGLPVGHYQVMSPSGESLCRFQVASYSLAGMVASLQEHHKEDERYHLVQLNLQSYGHPLQGGVWLTLRSDYTKELRTYALVVEGRVEARLELRGEGPFYLDVQHACDTELTATVPLPGTRKSERQGVILSTMGSDWSASLIASSDSVELRGLHISERSGKESPFRLSRRGSNRFQLTASREAGPLEVAVANPLTFEVVRYSWDRVKPGEQLEITVKGPLAVVAVGAFLGETPWEGWALAVTPSEVAPALRMPESLNAGDTLNMSLEFPTGYRAYLLVKDARLQTADRPGGRLAAQIQKYGRELKVESRTGEVFPSGSLFPRAFDQLELDRLLVNDLLDERQADRARRMMRWSNLSLLKILCEVLEVSAEQVLRDCFNWDCAGAEWREVVRYIPEGLARRYRVIPIAVDGNSLRLAMVNTNDIIAVDDIELITGFKVQPVPGDAEVIQRLIDQAYGVTDLVEVEETVKDISAQDFGSLDFDDEGGIALDRLSSRGLVEKAPEPEKREKERLEVLYCGWLDGEGTVELSLPTPGEPGEFLVEAFLAGPQDWVALSGRVATKKELALRLDLPEEVHLGDRVFGKLSVVGGMPPYRLAVEHKGQRQPVAEVLENRGPVIFPCLPGDYRFTVEELATGRQDVLERSVGTAGKVSGLARTVYCLREGETLTVDPQKGVLSLKTLSDLRSPIQRMAVGTADYHHLCCEQTASKILGACFAWLSATPGEKGRLESIVAAGVARERSMFLPGKGFSLYPGDGYPCTYWGPHAARYLCQLEGMKSCEMSATFASLLDEAVRLGYEAAAAHVVNWPPTERRNAFECYWEQKSGGSDGELVNQLARVQSHGWDGGGMVTFRSRESYIAAGLLRGRVDVSGTLARANRVLQDVGPGGTLYSTHDSVAALSLMSELEHLFSDNAGWPNIQGDPSSPESIEAVDGNLLIEVVRRVEEDWSQLTSSVDVKCGLTESRLVAGQKTILTVELPQGYKNGDLVWVCLPHALAQLRGGGQVRRFSVDFEGKSKIDIELLAVVSTQGKEQSVLVCLRNMFEEERVGLVKPLRVKVETVLGSGTLKLEFADDLRRADLTYEGLRGMPETLQQLQRLSLEVHRGDIERALDGILEHSLGIEASSVSFEWVESGLARCRARKASGYEELARYPMAVHTRLVGRLQMLAGLTVGAQLAQEGSLTLADRDRALSVMPTPQGPTATITLIRRERRDLAPLHRLSQVQQALTEGRQPEIESLQDLAWLPEVQQLIGLLSQTPIPKEEALEVLARLAGSCGSCGRLT